MDAIMKISLIYLKSIGILFVFLNYFFFMQLAWNYVHSLILLVHFFLLKYHYSYSPSSSSCGRHAFRWEKLKATPNALVFNLFRFVGPKILIKDHTPTHHVECYIQNVCALQCVYVCYLSITALSQPQQSCCWAYTTHTHARAFIYSSRDTLANSSTNSCKHSHRYFITYIISLFFSHSVCLFLTSLLCHSS